MFGFEGDLTVKPLEPMLVPERPRGGELDAAECFHCTLGAQNAIWADKHWQVGTPPEFGLPFIAGLAPREHVLLHEMEPDLLATFGDDWPTRSRPWRGLPARISRGGEMAAHTSTCSSWPGRWA